MEPSTLRRRKRDQLEAGPSSEQIEDPSKQKPTFESSRNVGFGAAFAALLLTRYFSAGSNIVHDCDEVFNYWEPLHFLLYKSGFQTWEYSSEFALRSYLYIIVHAIVGAPASLVYGSGAGKVNVFYMVRFALAAISAFTDASLVASVSSKFGKRLATYLLLLLCFTSGCYTASTTFLPSTFSMYFVTFATACMLAENFAAAVAWAAFGVLIGWPFSGLAVAPLVIFSLVQGSFSKVFIAGFTTSAALLILSASVDRFFYGEWKFSVLNLVLYNVVGGGDSYLYGVESPLFYLRNAFNNFNLALLLALELPLLLALARRNSDKLLLLAVSPLFLWFGFMSLQPHKEERFLYPVYSLLCLAAAASIDRLPELSSNSQARKVLKALRPALLSIILVVSYSRTTSLLHGYSSPMHIYNHLPGDPAPNSTVCIGSEWHRFPSSFFLPSPNYQVKWLDDGFRGLLPLPFDPKLGGTAAAPGYFNKMNKAFDLQFLRNESLCDYLVELELQRTGVEYRGGDRSVWEVVFERYFLDNEKSPALHRAFFIPWGWQSRNAFGTYRLLKRKTLGK